MLIKFSVICWYDKLKWKTCKTVAEDSVVLLHNTDFHYENVETFAIPHVLSMKWFRITRNESPD
ncbi:CLUMA_CG008889, isoform A [Clunio marinus]|uniref:CLUMA_CG008889, isoform A n=1 Tax=Clunio marinus TaxID=568069 RepID=A0A1J1I8H8_9DIPT|nr:CLUMA_CG008889, isoform A [Clunio marinus]